MTRTLFDCEIGEENKKLTLNAGKGIMRSTRCRGVYWFEWYRKHLHGMLIIRHEDFFYSPVFVSRGYTHTHNLYFKSGAKYHSFVSRLVLLSRETLEHKETSLPGPRPPMFR